MSSLKEYRHKRDFRKTSEPSGAAIPSPEVASRMFVVQKHKARRLHYDFRLELDGVLKSWAVPKGPSLDPGDKRLAVRVEDHPLEYAGFEGVIPPGEYGAGSVLVWDRGTWEPEGDEEPGRALSKGVLKLSLKGRKLKGSWVLAKMGDGGENENNWLLIKHKDPSASAGAEESIVERYPKSVQSDRTIEEVSKSSGEVFSHGILLSNLEGSRPCPEIPADAKPELATQVKSAPQGSEWLHELKHDGYRILASKRGSSVRLVSRNDKDWTARFLPVARALQDFPGNALLDGEIVVLTSGGRSSFQALQRSLKGENTGPLVYFVFDLLWYQDYDLRGVALVERKKALRELLERAFPSEESTVRFSDHQEGKGPEFLQQACAAGVEGIVCKRAASRYSGRRTRDWLKIKCSRRQEFVIGGFTAPGGSRTGFGALLLGYYDEAGGLRYAGRVGTGFDEALLRTLHRRLKADAVSRSPFADLLSRQETRTATWVQPKLVAEVTFTEWTDDGRLRQPSFQGLREDKEPPEVRREVLPEPPKKPVAPRASARPRRSEVLEIAGVAITHPERPVFPDAGVTKGQVAQYYHDAASWLLRLAGGRPLSVVRCPEGRQKACFYQKHHTAGMPRSIGSVEVPEHSGTDVYMTVDSAEGLVGLAQFGVLEIHPWLARNDQLEKPDMMIFDLDPGEGVRWEEVLGAAFLFRDALRDVGLESLPKLTGGKGFHVVVPLKRQLEFGVVKSAAKALAERIRDRNPDRFLTSATKAKRQGKIYLDYLRNGRGATAIAPYSLRARAGAPVAVPIGWNEVRPELRSDSFSIATVSQRFAAKDPWVGFFETKQTLTKAVLRELGVRG